MKNQCEVCGKKIDTFRLRKDKSKYLPKGKQRVFCSNECFVKWIDLEERKK